VRRGLKAQIAKASPDERFFTLKIFNEFKGNHLISTKAEMVAVFWIIIRLKMV
jgi:hypothetical protein